MNKPTQRSFKQPPLTEEQRESVRRMEEAGNLRWQALALLKQWLELFPSSNSGRGTWESLEQRKVINDTKRFLKEVKKK